MKTQKPDWLVWVQPMDDKKPDLMSRAGVPLSPRDYAERERWLEEIDLTAREGRRRSTHGGFVSVSAKLVVAELPLQANGSAPGPTVVVALNRRRWTSLELQHVLDDLVRMAREGSYRYEPGFVRKGLDEVANAAWPINMLGRNRR